MASLPRVERRRVLVVETDRGWRVDDLHSGKPHAPTARSHARRLPSIAPPPYSPRAASPASSSRRSTTLRIRRWLGAARHGEDLTRGVAGGSPPAAGRVTNHTPARSRPAARPAARPRHASRTQAEAPRTATSTGAALTRRQPRSIDRCLHRPTPEAPARSQGPPPRAPAPPTLDHHPPSNPKHEHHARACFV